jgi:NAD-dependent deacetylase
VLPSIDDFERILFFTGAGISKESGVPTFRGPGGIWKSYDYPSVACQTAFDDDPEQVWEFHNYRRSIVAAAAPNRAHAVIAALAGQKRVHVITQNIDGLHQQAGSEDVVELHGSLWRIRCDACGARHHGRENPLEVLRCACGAYWRPDVVWFGDTLFEPALEAASRALGACDLLVSIGTSGMVHPAAEMPVVAKQRGATLVEINPEPTPVSDLYDHTLRTTAAEGLEALGASAS